MQVLLSLFFFFYFVVEKKIEQTEVTLPACWKNSCSRSHSDSVLPVSHTVLLSFALSAAAECVQLGVCVCVCVCKPRGTSYGFSFSQSCDGAH